MRHLAEGSCDTHAWTGDSYLHQCPYCKIERLEAERVKLLMGACAKLRQACEILDQIERELDQELKEKSDE